MHLGRPLRSDPIGVSHNQGPGICGLQEVDPVQGGLRESEVGLPTNTLPLRVPSVETWNSHPTPGPGPTCPFTLEPQKPCLNTT